jgi:long-chain fatty acid transport protein
MKTLKHLLKLTPVAAACALPLAALATDGMNMEGYGPISTGMGGASQAIDHGTAAMAQNPATLSLMAPGARFDAAFGVLGPDVTSSVPGMPAADSGGTSYVMPAFGYARRSGALTYGIGIFAQGGMGTEYAADTFLALGSGRDVRSELGVGRVLLPLSYQVTPEFAVGGTLDFMWAGLDLRMAASGAQLGGLVTGATGTLGQQLPGLAQAPWTRIDFSNDNDFTGEASATGWAAKLGAVYRPMPTLTFGASYQFESALDDMETSANGASLSAAGGFIDYGRITVVDFQWPSTAAVGMAWQVTPAVLLAADFKRIGWSSVMKDFRMRYDSAGTTNPGLSGSVSFALPQNWEDEDVINLGIAWAVNEALTLRAGANLTDNPIPDAYVNPLFPATVEEHYTLGFGYRFGPVHELNASMTIAPESKVTNSQGVVITHEQMNFQFMYSYRF